jgi:glycerophosphoryl diester phosphodiesterase
MQKHFFSPEPRIFAHRGDAAHFPENTLPSFKSAVEIGADVIETDVRRSRDGHFMVFHDDTIDRITNGQGRVGDYTLEELKRFDAGYRYSAAGECFPFRGKKMPIPSLEEALSEFPQQRFNVDLKADDPSQAADYCALIRRCNAAERVLTASEFTGNLKAVRSLMPEMATSASHGEVAAVFFLYKSGMLFAKNGFEADALQIPEFYRNWHVAAPGLVLSIHGKGIRVHVWTVNREADMCRLLDIGVDGIITDDPCLLKKVIESRG